MSLRDRRRALMAAKKARLPAEYQEVEWIGYNSNATYLTTPIKMSDATHVVSDIAKVGLPSGTNSGSVFPGATNGGYPWGTLENIYGSSWQASPQHLKTETFERTTITSTKTASGNVNVRLGYYSASFCPSLHFYTLKIFNGDDLLFDGIPCFRRVDSKIGMFDTVSKVFVTASGTWQKGADVN